MIQGIIETLDQNLFHIVIFSLKEKGQAVTPVMQGDTVALAIRKAANKFIELPKTSLSEMRKAIEAEKLDVLVFAEIGMDPANYLLAFSKLAHVSVATHGHASTSGIPTIGR